jgi:hypothetical protein
MTLEALANGHVLRGAAASMVNEWLIASGK